MREPGAGGGAADGPAAARHVSVRAKCGRGQAGMHSRAYMQGRGNSSCAQNPSVRFARTPRRRTTEGPTRGPALSLLVIVVDPTLIGIVISQPLARINKTLDC